MGTYEKRKLTRLEKFLLVPYVGIGALLLAGAILWNAIQGKPFITIGDTNYATLDAVLQAPSGPVNFAPTNMTSDSAPSPYVASASNEYSSSYDAYKCFDGSTSDYWLAEPVPTSGSPQWIQINLGSSANAKMVYSYSIVGVGSSYQTWMPTAWTLQGSTSGSFSGEQVTLDTRSGYTSWTIGVASTFFCNSPSTTVFQYLRWVITAVNGGSTGVVCGQIQINGWTGIPQNYVVPVPASAMNYSIGGNRTLNSNVTLDIQQGAVINIPAGDTLTINGHIRAGRYQIFSGNITGISFGPGSVDDLPVDWFGTDLSGNLAISDNSTAINAALASVFNASTGKTTVRQVSLFPYGNYVVQSRILEFWNSCIEGNGATIAAGSNFPSTPGSLGFAVIWYGYHTSDMTSWGGLPGDYGYNIFLKNCTIANGNFVGIVRYCHGRHGVIQNINFTGGGINSLYLRHPWNSNGTWAGGTVSGTPETITANGTCGPYTKSLVNAHVQDVVVTASSPSSQTVYGDNYTWEFAPGVTSGGTNAAGVGGSYDGNAGTITVYFASPVTNGTTINIIYNYCTDSPVYHNNHNSTAEINCNYATPGASNVWGPLVVEPNTDAQTQSFSGIGGVCPRLMTYGGWYSEFNCAGGECLGSWNTGSNSGGWASIVRITSQGPGIHFKNWYADSTNLAFWASALNAPSLSWETLAIDGYGEFNVTPGATQAGGFIASTVGPIPCSISGSNFTVPGSDPLWNCAGGGVWVILEDWTNQNRFIYLVTGGTTNASGTFRSGATQATTTYTVSTSAFLPGSAAPPATVPSTITTVRRMSNDFSWYTVATGSTDGIHVSQDHVLRSLTIGPAPAGVAGYNPAYGQLTGDKWHQGLNNSASFSPGTGFSSGSLAAGTTGTMTATKNGIQANSNLTVSCGGNLPAGVIKVDTWTSTNTINVSFYNGSGSTWTPGTLTWYYGGVY
jgi:hypothetical protein